MAAVIITPTARNDLESLIRTHSLPPSTRERFKRSLQPLASFPMIGAPFEGRWSRFRFVLGPWRWMIVVYHYDADADRVAVVTVQDGRASRAPTTTGRAHT
jgi:plasmid stabilization system protein ParE